MWESKRESMSPPIATQCETQKWGVQVIVTASHNEDESSHILASGGVTQIGPDRFTDKMTCLSFLNWCNPIHSLECFARRAAVEGRVARRAKHARLGSSLHLESFMEFIH